MRGRFLPFGVLTLCILVFYGPILCSTGSVLASPQSDLIAHMLVSLGDDRPAGRFFHAVELSANTRLWAQDVRYNPLHLIRLISIGWGASLAGWGILLVGVHSLLFLAVFYYSRRVFRVGMFAALTGGAAAFFSVAWLEWIALVYWTAGAVGLAVSLGEYWLFITTGRRRHLLACVVANALQPYVTHSQALIPTQLYGLGAVFLMALARKGNRRQTIGPWIQLVLPLTALGWLPILAPMLFSIGAGLVAREETHALAWGLNGSVFTGLLGLLCPSPFVVGDLLMKLGLSRWVQPPNSFLFGSFLFVPSLLALRRSGQRSLAILAAGAALYIGSLAAAELILIPSPLIASLGFWRAFLFPLLSGFVVAAGVGLPEFGRSDNASGRFLHRFYAALLVGAAVGLIALCAVTPDLLIRFASRLGLVGSGAVIPRFLTGTRGFAAGIALGLLGYFGYRRARGRRSLLGPIALSAAIVAPTLGFGVGQEWYVRPPELDAALSPPSEFRFLRERLPSYEYRVGIIPASDLLLAQGDWRGFWAVVEERQNHVLSSLQGHDLRLRQGLGFVLPQLHFLAPIHVQLRKDGNPFLQKPESPESAFLNRRNVIVRPEAEIFEEYGVRYWLSNFDLQGHHPGKFIRVYPGEYATVFENPHAKPVAFFLDEPEVPLPLRHLRDGIAVKSLNPNGGRLSIHADLRWMRARAVDSAGRIASLALEPSGPRWIVDVPTGSSAVLFTAREFVPLLLLAAASGAAFLLLSLMLIRNRNCR